jgi:dephospho-CoA kinase
VDAPQLFESGFDAECDRILAVLAPYEARLARVLRRDGITEAQAVARLNAAHPDAFFRERADAILWNEGEIGELDGKLRELLSAWEVLP